VQPPSLLALPQLSSAAPSCARRGPSHQTPRAVRAAQGKIRNDGSGLATFDVKYNCLVFRPFKGEALDAVVATVNKVRACRPAGRRRGRRDAQGPPPPPLLPPLLRWSPSRGAVRRRRAPATARRAARRRWLARARPLPPIPPHHHHTHTHTHTHTPALQVGFFAQAGPVQLFVSNHVSRRAAARAPRRPPGLPPLPASRRGRARAVGAAGPRSARPAAASSTAPRARPPAAPPRPPPTAAHCPAARRPQLIPDDYDFSSSDENCYVSRDAGVRIREGSEVRLRIIGMRTDSSELVGGWGLGCAWGWGAQGGWARAGVRL
jgi:hypothetical protein